MATEKLKADNERINEACNQWMQGVEEGHTRMMFGVRCDYTYNKLLGKPNVSAVCIIPTADDGDEDPINMIANVMNVNPKFRLIMCTAVDLWRAANKQKK